MKRFQIAYRDGGYRVSIPNYDGGEVVDAEAFDAVREALRVAEQLLITMCSVAFKDGVADHLPYGTKQELKDWLQSKHQLVLCKTEAISKKAEGK